LIFDDGRISPVNADLRELGASFDLPYDPPRYFVISAEAVAVPIASLVLRHLRPQGISNGARLMRAAYAGSHPRRQPIAACRCGKDFIVDDGNSTVLNAFASGWPDVPAIVQGD
jgi:hypothetical protein